MKRKIFVCFIFFVVLCFIFIGCKKEKVAIVMKIAHAMAQDTSRHQALLKFQEYVHNELNGEIEVQIFPAGQLGDESKLIEQLKLGALEGYVGGVFDAQTSKLNLFLMPFMFKNQETFLRVAKSSFVKNVIMADAEKKELKMLSIGDGGSRNITNNIRPIKSPKDLKGIKMRTPPVDAYMKSMQALGANTVTIPYGEVYMALKTGVADGQENPLMNIVTMKFQEVQKYITMVNYNWAPEPFEVSLSWYNKLSPKQKKVISAGAWLYAETQSRLRAENENNYLKTIKDAGLQVYYPTPEERAQFIKACEPVCDYFVEKGFFTKEEMNEFRKIATSK